MMKRYGDADSYGDYVKSRFVDGDVDILIVCSKLLTGFDAPLCQVLYIDKELKEHGLLQAIARTNRLHEGKDYGLIVGHFLHPLRPRRETGQVGAKALQLCRGG